jgi:SAM-dependent methyltransferase
MHQSSLDNMAAFKKKYLSDKINEPLKIYDIGSCDVNGTYRPIFGEPRWEYSGVDVEKGKNVDVTISDPYTWREIRSNSADVVISGQAFEHIEYPWLTVLEIERILKPEGLCCIIAPSGGPDHKYPVDCWRFHPDGFAALAKLAGLSVLEIYAQPEGGNYQDGSGVWQDCVLIAKKNSDKTLVKIKGYISHELMRFSHRLTSM